MAILNQKVRAAFGRQWAWLILTTLSGLCVAPPCAAEEITAPEYKVKAAFLYNFAKLVEWPSNAFASAQSPFVLGVLGTDPFGKSLDEVVAGKKVHGHPVVVTRFEHRLDATNCHLLFISALISDSTYCAPSWISIGY